MRANTIGPLLAAASVTQYAASCTSWALCSDAGTDLASQAIASRNVTSLLPFGSSIGSLNLRDQPSANVNSRVERARVVRSMD